MALLTMMIVLYAAAVEPWALKLLAWMDRHAAAQWAGVALAVALGGGLVFYNRGLLLYLPNNDIVLRDQYRESVGVDGYFSAYDYLRKNIHNAAVQIDGGLMYYVYGENFSNLPTKLHYPLGVDWMVPQRDPQYYVVFCTNFWTYEQSECRSTLIRPALMRNGSCSITTAMGAFTSAAEDRLALYGLPGARLVWNYLQYR